MTDTRSVCCGRKLEDVEQKDAKLNSAYVGLTVLLVWPAVFAAVFNNPLWLLRYAGYLVLEFALYGPWTDE